MEAYEYILQELLKIPYSKSTGSVLQIRTRCPICNNENNKCYVGVMGDSKLLGYDCKHCMFSGKVGPEFLKLFNISSDEYILELKSNRKNTKIVNPVTKMTKLNLKIPDLIRPEDKYKIEYLENRFQRRIGLSELRTYKIVLNFKDLFEYNNFDYLQFEPDREKRKYLEFLADEYTKNFVGMLTVDNNKINFRNVGSAKINERYKVYVVDKNIINPYMYMPDIPIDLLAPRPIINMSEGNYDIIGAKMKFSLNEDNSNVYVAVGTKKAYKRVIHQVLKMTGFLNAKINLFIDNDNFTDGGNSENLDIDVGFYKTMLKSEIELFDSITLIYNKSNKDFGDLSKPIDPVKISLI